MTLTILISITQMNNKAHTHKSNSKDFQTDRYYQNSSTTRREENTIGNRQGQTTNLKQQ